MSEARPRGRFVWFDLMTTEPEKAVEFYTKVVGWGTTQWEGSSAVHDVDQCQPADRRRDAAAAGGRARRRTGSPTSPRPTSMPPRSRPSRSAPRCWSRRTTCRRSAASRCSATRRARCSRSSCRSHRRPATKGRRSQGEFSWHELATREQPAAFRFYETLFGWTKTSAMDMGPHGQYQMFGRNDVELGGMFNKAAEMPGPPAWAHYIMVDDINRAAEATKAGGGQVLNGPMEVPGRRLDLPGARPAGRDVRGAREGETERLTERTIVSCQLPATMCWKPEAVASSIVTTPTDRSRRTPARSAAGTPSPAGRSARPGGASGSSVARRRDRRAARGSA